MVEKNTMSNNAKNEFREFAWNVASSLSKTTKNSTGRGGQNTHRTATGGRVRAK